MGNVRENLLEIFPVWLRTAAEVVKVDLGEVVHFSETLFFFPDCRVAVGGEIYLDNEKLKDVPVPLFVDRDGLIDDLLAHKPGTFFYPGNTLNFASTWDEATPAQVKDYLWYALENSLFLFSFRVEFEVDMNRRNLEDSPYSPWYSCYLGSFSERVEPKFRSVGWGR